jgi:flagellar protein FliO/FliZ
LFAAAAWAFKRSRLGTAGRRDRIAIETACSIGERRSLVIVAVEGRRLLLGVTPGQVSLLTELGTQPGAFSQALDRAATVAGGLQPSSQQDA